MCVLANNIPGCVYEGEKRSQPMNIRLWRNVDARLSGQHLGDSDPVEVPTALFTSSSPKSDSVPSATQVVAVRRKSFGRRISLGSNPSISIVSSFLVPTIPPELRIPLSFLGTEKLQVQFSETEATDLDLRLCVSEQDSSATISLSDTSRLWVLPRLINLGVKFSHKKLDALLRGDQSGTVLDPAFVCGSHVLGMLFSRDVNDTPAMVRFHAIRAQIAWERLVELFDSNNHGSKVQAAMKVAAVYILIRMKQHSILYIQKSCDLIETGNMGFIPASGHVPEFSEELHEVLVTLSQTIYWANYLFLMRDGPEPRATFKLEKEFRIELPVGEISLISYPELILCHSKSTHFSSSSVL